MNASPSARRGREVRERLQAAAAELIAERGWSAVSTRLLADRAGVGPGLVHYHFPSLQALLSEAALGTVRALADELGALLDRADGLDEGLTGLLAALDHYDGRDTTSLLFSEVYLAAARDPELGAALADVLGATRRRIARWLAAHGAPAPEDTAAVLTAALDGVMLHRPLDAQLTSARVAPVLRRALHP
ncbi:TetR/AcrR family transcriptional regulator [Streptomyces chumphonensis]|uniref:TetR/AcrR family transcriptional regulator n=1 Tax=Streptomyces chumphonensis TaxID=1214925 RepID=A0A927F2P5_9ACTN|nr:TetR/AcrR family transcriptional regulator [Streptomyces chumphonensis]MBD3933094.1 TetR/AcrR family transcriptional regulator [Streptomyces chumphonensis]